MEAKRTTILGLSFGNRFMGYAVARDHELLEWGVKNFRGSWSKAKQKEIWTFCQGLIRLYVSTGIAVKISHPSRRACGMSEILDEMIQFAASLGIPICTITIQQIKYFCSGSDKTDRKVAEQYTKQQYPEYFENIKTDTEYTNRYYGKLFEAVVCALMVEQEPTFLQKTRSGKP